EFEIFKVGPDGIPEVWVKAFRKAGTFGHGNVLRFGLPGNIRLWKSAHPLGARLVPHVRHQARLANARSRRKGVELPGTGWLVKLLASVEWIEVHGGSAVDHAGVELSPHERLRHRCPGAAPNEVFGQGYAQHAPCHAVDRE